MDTIKNYKDRAIESLSGKWGNAAVATLILYIVFGGIHVCLKSYGSLLQLLLLPLSWGLTVLFLNNLRENKIDLSQLFDGFKDYVRIFLTTLLVGIYTFLWSLLLIVPGIIKSYSYALTPYILKDEPGMKNNDAIEMSMEMMEGHKMQLFLLDLSMIGWFILSILTAGIGFLFLVPYVYTCHAHFYEDLKAELLENEDV